jgi:trans-aconitate methyltransferase
LSFATGIGEGVSVLDVGCGSGEFCELAAARGARVSGIDAAAGLIEVARRRLPEADLRVGAIEQLPDDVLEGLARQAGLTPQRADEVEMPYEFPDSATLERALLAIARSTELTR